MSDKKKLDPLVVDVARVKPLQMGAEYQSRMILDHVITGRDGVIQMNHGTVAPRSALGGGVHDEDEIYYILSGKGKIKLNDDIVDVYGGQVIFIPAGCFHALDNTESDEEMTILTFWKDYRDNEAYAERVRQWGKSFKTIDED